MFARYIFQKRDQLENERTERLARLASEIRKLLLITTPRVGNAIFVLNLTRPIMHLQKRGKYTHSARSQTILQGSGLQQ